MKRYPFAIALTCLTAVIVGTPARASETGLLLDLNISKAGSNTFAPKLWGKIGSKSTVSADGNLTFEVTSTGLTESNVTLEISMTEKTSGGYRTSKVSATVPLDKSITMQLGGEAATPWSVQFTPRITTSPGAPAA